MNTSIKQRIVAMLLCMSLLFSGIAFAGTEEVPLDVLAAIEEFNSESSDTAGDLDVSIDETAEPVEEDNETSEATAEPEQEDAEPSAIPEVTEEPSVADTAMPAETELPTTAEPTAEVTAEPTPEPTSEVTAEPAPEITAEPTNEPEVTLEPEIEPTAEPEPEATAEITIEPDAEATLEPVVSPEATQEVTAEPTAEIPTVLFMKASSNAISLDVNGYKQTTTGPYAWTTCGAACSLMLLNYFNCKDALNLNDTDYFGEILKEDRSFENICRNVNNYLGETAYAVYWDCTSVSDLITRVTNSLKRGRPLIISMNAGNPEYERYSGNDENPTTGHYIVISGVYNDYNDKGIMTTYFEIKEPLCPASKTINVPADVLYAAMPYPNNGWKHPIMYGLTEYKYRMTETCTYKITKDVTLRKEPFDSAEKGSTLKKGTTVTSVAVVDNGTNYWLELGGNYKGQYIFSGYSNKGVKNGNQYLSLVSDNSSITWAGDNLNGKTLIYGQSLTLGGTINSTNPMTQITAQIYKGNSCWGSPIVIPVEAGKQYSYYVPASKLDTSIKFGQLPSSTDPYRLELTIQYKYNRLLSTGNKVINKTFYVGGGSGGSITVSSISFQNIEYPQTYRISSSGWTLGKGTITSSNNLRTLKTEIVDSNGKAISSFTRSISGKSYSVKSLDTFSSDDNGVHFSYIKNTGTYRWILTATDVTGYSAKLTMTFKAVSSGSTSVGTASQSNTVTVPPSNPVTPAPPTYAPPTYVPPTFVPPVTQPPVTNPPTVNRPTQISIDQGSEIYVGVGKTVGLNVSYSPSNSYSSLAWSSSSSKYATVNNNGAVTGVKKGTSTITVKTENGLKDTIKVRVVDANKVAAVALDRSGTVTMNIGETLHLNATIQPSSVSSKLTWSSSSKSKASVDSNGLVTAKAEGTVTITVKSSNSKKDTVKIKVVDPYKPDTVSLVESGTVTAELGATLQLHASVMPSTAKLDRLKWSSSSSSRATVNEYGVVFPKKEGTVTVTVKTPGGKKDTVKVKIIDPYKPTTISLSHSDTITMPVGQILQLNVTISPNTAAGNMVIMNT